MILRRVFPFLIFAALWAAATGWNVARFDRQLDANRRLQSALVALPRPEIVRLMALGFRDVLADAYWVGGIHYFGEPKNAQVSYAELPNYLELVNELAPDFRFAYIFGGMAIPWNRGGKWVNIEAANKVLERGIARFPEDWFMRLMLAYNYSEHLKEYSKAADQITEAAKTPGSPSYLTSLASRMLVVSGDLSAAKLLAQKFAEETPDPLIKARMLRRQVEIDVEADLRRLDAAIMKYREAEGALPRSLDALCSKGYLDFIPEEPFGGEYSYDSETGTVKSSTLHDRIVLYRKD
jgi:tetratricopeptide (TPR) repeat protein